MTFPVLAERVDRLTNNILGASFPDGLEDLGTPAGEVFQCARCGSSVEFVECWKCVGGGLLGHDCGEDCCACLHPKPNVVCDVCDFLGFFGHCVSTPDYCRDNPLLGREHVRSTARSGEWWS